MSRLSVPSQQMPMSYDVIVVGAGSAGVVAAVQSARAGARTLLIEKSGLLGGTATLAGVNFPGLFHAWGRQVIAGIGWEWVTSTVTVAGDSLPDFKRWRDGPHWKMQIRVNQAVYASIADEMLEAADVDVLHHTLVAEVRKNENWQVTLCCKEGLRSVETSVLIDCTGDANVVGIAGFPLRRSAQLQPGTLVMHASGYEIEALDLESLERDFLQAVERGEMRRSDFWSSENPVSSFLRNHGNNSVHIQDIKASTSAGKTQAERKARATLLRIVKYFRKQRGLESFKIEWCAPECGIRETVTVEGETCISCEDYMMGRVWEDSLCYSFYPIDLHRAGGKGGIEQQHLREGVFPTIPLGALLPRGSRNFLVAGRCASGEQKANSAYRVQASCMAMGQVAGATGALASTSGRELREIPLEEIRVLLRYHGAIVPESQTSLAMPG